MSYLPRRGRTLGQHAGMRRCLHGIADVLGIAAEEARLRIVPPAQPEPPLEVEEPRGGLGRRVALLCHFDRAGRIAPYLRATIREMLKEDISVVVCSNSGGLLDDDRGWLRAQGVGLVRRRNRGLDFGAWRDAINAFNLARRDATDLLILQNDSVYGPFKGYREILGQINFNVADVWAATDSWQHRYHLQSYFIAFGPQATGSEVFAEFWRSLPDYRLKKQVIMRGEIGLSQALLRGGLQCRAIWPYTRLVETLGSAMAGEELEEGARNARVPFVRELCNAYDKALLSAASRRVPLNPSANLWRTLLTLEYPFIKRELLRLNPAQVSDISCWSHYVASLSRDWIDLIHQDLSRSLYDTAP